MKGFTSSIRREPRGPVGPGRPVELPDDDGGLEVRAGAGRRQHRGAQAVGHHPGLVDAGWSRRCRTSSRPASCNLVCGDRDTGAALTSAPDPADGVDHRIDPGRHRGGHRGRGRRQGRPPRARRQGPGDRLRRRRPGRRGRGHLGRRASSTAARTAPPPPGCSASRASTTSSSPSWPRRRRRPGPATTATTRTSSTGRSTTPNQLGHVSGLVERAPDHARVVTGGERVGDQRLLLRADGDRRPAADRRADHAPRCSGR